MGEKLENPSAKRVKFDDKNAKEIVLDLMCHRELQQYDEQVDNDDHDDDDDEFQLYDELEIYDEQVEEDIDRWDEIFKMTVLVGLDESEVETKQPTLPANKPIEREQCADTTYNQQQIMIENQKAPQDQQVEDILDILCTRMMDMTLMDCVC